MHERVSKILSAHGVCSRRAAEELIAAGRITVNGAAAQLGQKADAETDAICVDGEPIPRRSPPCYLMLHKPRGYVTTAKDEKGRKTVLELIDIPQRVWPVGRLDMDSEGLLLLTNDGDLTDCLLHPRHEVKKVYHVWVCGPVRAALGPLREMDALDGEAICRPSVQLLRETAQGGVLAITIHEGKNRQVRRMCAACGLEVRRLLRVQEGAVSLGDLAPGQWRHLTEEELMRLLRCR